MNRRPITRQRSEWIEQPPLAVAGLAHCTVHRRNVHDGVLTAIVGEEPQGLHLSISHRRPGRENSRYPTWDEIADARDVLLPDDRGFVMHLPRASEYVALHDTTFHLHEHPERTR